MIIKLRLPIVKSLREGEIKIIIIIISISEVKN